MSSEHLSKQDPASVPKDWDLLGKYHPMSVSIWQKWLDFVPVFVGMRTKDGSRLYLVPPELPWTLAPNQPVVFLLMNYMTTQLTNAMNGNLHPASAKRSDGSLMSCCWELIRLSVGEDLYEERCGKAEFTPFAFPYNGESTDIFSKGDVDIIMKEYKKFLDHVFTTVGSTDKSRRMLLCSQAVRDQVRSLFGGKKPFRVYVKEHPFAFFSTPGAKTNEIKTSCHPEFILNGLYLNAYTETMLVDGMSSTQAFVHSSAIRIHVSRVATSSIRQEERWHSS